MATLLTRRLALIAAIGITVFAAIFIGPQLAPQGSKEPFPAWRSVDGVPVVDELPGSFVGVLRIARERTSEAVRTSIVLGAATGAACERVRVRVAAGTPFESVPDLPGASGDCAGLRLISLRTLAGPIAVTIGKDRWLLDPSLRDPRSCQLGRDRTCAYWLYEGGRFGEPISSDVERVQSGTPETVLAVGDALRAGEGDRASRTITTGDPETLLRCAAGAAPECSGGLAARAK